MFDRFFNKKSKRAFSCVVEGFSLSFELEPKKTVLESALKEQIEYPHNCQVGSCKECCSKLISGHVHSYVELEYLFNKSEIAAGYFLPCQAEATSDLVIKPLSSGGLISFKGTILSIECLTLAIKRVSVQVDKALKPSPGQYSNLEIPELGATRAYSFVKQDDDAKIYAFDVALRAQGKVSSWLHQQKNVGKPIALSNPQGSFSMPDTDGPLLCVGGGSGKGVLLNLLESNKKQLESQPIEFLYSTKKLDELYDMDQIEKLESDLNFKFTPFITSHNSESHTLKKGRITEQLNLVIQNLIKERGFTSDFSSWRVLLCGASGLVDDSVTILVGMGFDPASIAYDKFEASGKDKIT